MSAPLAVIVSLALGGCVTMPETPPEVRTNTITVKVPVPVPCFTEAERPAMPAPTFTTEAEIVAASPEQLAAADRADRLALEIYTNSVDALFLKCRTKGTAP